ncbi:MAG: DUF5683 domain-containing protein [Bacteroidales bacterium]
MAFGKLGFLVCLCAALLLTVPLAAQDRSRTDGYKNWNNDPLESGYQTDSQFGDGYSQQDDTYVEPPEEKNKPLDTIYFKHSPVKASVYSAVLPGLGQIYNRKWWKLPIVYGAIGGCGYAFLWNKEKYEDYRKGYVHYFDKDPTTNHYLSLTLAGVDKKTGTVINAPLVERQLVYYKDYYRRYRDMMLMVTVGAYLLNMIDAAVDAHLANFSVTEDITMQIVPQIAPMMANSSLVPIYGISLGVSF